MPGIDRLSEMADGSQQVEGMQAMADMAQTMQAPPMPTGVSSIPFLRDEMIPRMEKQLTFAAKFKGIFGSESTYTILITAIKDYVKAKDDKAKAEPKKRILQTSNDWIKKHGESKDPNDVQKKQCIDRVKQALEPPAQAPQKKPEPKPAPPAPPPAPVPGVPAPVIPKIEDPTPVVEPVVEAGPSSQEPFERIKNDFEAYQEMASGTLEGAGTLFAACQKLYQVRTGITSWMKEFGKRTEEEDVERRGKLKLIEISMGALEADVNVTENLQMHVTGLNVNQLAKGKFFVRTMKVAMQMPSGAAIGEMSNIEILAGAFHFSNLKLSYGGSMEVMTGFTISAPSLELSHEGAGYRVMAGADLSLEAPGGAGVSNFSAKGRVQAGYDFANKKLLSPTVEGGELSATFFDTLDISAVGFDYLDNTIKVASGTLKIRAFDQESSVAVSDIVYSAAGISFSKVEFNSDKRYEPYPGFSVDKPKLTLTKNGAGWDLEGSGRLGVSFGNQLFRVDKVESDVTLNYGIGTSTPTSFMASNGSLDMTIFNSLTLQMANMNVENGEFSAGTGDLKINLLGNTIKGTATEITYSGAKGFGLKDAALTSPGTYSPVPGIEIKDPGLMLRQEASGWKIEGEGDLGLKGGLGDIVRLNSAAGKVKLLYDVSSKTLEDAQLSEGAVDLTLYNMVNVVGSGISFDKATGELGIGSGSVKVNVPSSPFATSELAGHFKKLRIGSSALNWDEIGVNLGGEVAMGGFVFQPPEGIIKKEGNSFLIALKDASGKFNVSEWLDVKGKVSLQWSPGQGLKVTAGELQAATQEIDVFQSFIPFFAGGLDFKTGFTMPFMAGPVPMEVGFEVRGRADAKMKLDAKMSYANDAFTTTGKIALNPELGMYIMLRVGVGSSVIAYLGGYIKGELDVAATGDLGYTATATQQSDGKYKMDEFSFNYGVGADMTANLKGGVEFRALYFIQKELYEVNIKSWNLGHAEMAGKHDVISGTNLEKKKTNVFQALGKDGIQGASLGIPKPDNIMEHRAYRQSLDNLMAAINEIELNAEDNKDETAEIIVARHKERLTQNFQQMIEKFNAKYEDLREKRDSNQERINVFKQSHVIWLQRQNEKLSEAVKKNSKRGIGWSLVPWPHWKNTLWYTKKIAQGGAKYDRNLQDKQQKLDTIIEELGIFDTELNRTQSIMSQLDDLLKPGGSMALESIINPVQTTQEKMERANLEGLQAHKLEQGTQGIFEFEDSEVLRDKDLEADPKELDKDAKATDG